MTEKASFEKGMAGFLDIPYTEKDKKPKLYPGFKFEIFDQRLIPGEWYSVINTSSKAIDIDDILKAASNACNVGAPIDEEDWELYNVAGLGIEEEPLTIKTDVYWNEVKEKHLADCFRDYKKAYQAGNEIEYALFEKRDGKFSLIPNAGGFDDLQIEPGTHFGFHTDQALFYGYLGLKDRTKVINAKIPPGFDFDIVDDHIPETQRYSITNTTNEDLAVMDVLLAASNPDNLTKAGVETWTIHNVGRDKKALTLTVDGVPDSNTVKNIIQSVKAYMRVYGSSNEKGETQ